MYLLVIKCIWTARLTHLGNMPSQDATQKPTQEWLLTTVNSTKDRAGTTNEQSQCNLINTVTVGERVLPTALPTAQLYCVTNINLSVNTHTCIQTYTKCIHTSLHTARYTCMCTSGTVRYTHVQTHTHTHPLTYIHAHMHTHTHAHTHTCMHSHTHTHTHTHTRTRTHTHTHTHTRTHTHTLPF